MRDDACERRRPAEPRPRRAAGAQIKFPILSRRRGRRARRRGPQLRAVHRSADARSTRASPPVVGRAFTRTARRRSSCAEPTRNMKRALVGGTPHVQGSRHREPTVASPGATFARRAAAPSSSTLWTPTHAASWRGPGALAPPLPVRNWFDVGATSGSSSRGPVGQGLPSDARIAAPVAVLDGLALRTSV